MQAAAFGHAYDTVQISNKNPPQTNLLHRLVSGLAALNGHFGAGLLRGVNINRSQKGMQSFNAFKNMVKHGLILSIQPVMLFKLLNYMQ